jgi:hypothetical protein
VPLAFSSGAPSSDVLGVQSRPQIYRVVPSLDDVGDADVLLTNVLFTAITLVLILVTASVFNQVMTENQSVVEGWLKGFMGPIQPFKDAFQSLTHRWVWLRTGGWILLILGLTVGVYGFLEPGFGFNEKSLVVVASLFIAAGMITYVSEGLEAAYARHYRQEAAVRIFPVAVVIALISVVVSRFSGFEPGVIYGFVGVAVLLRPSTMSSTETARTVYLPAIIILALSVLCWLAIGPLREAMADDGGSFLQHFFEGVMVAIFIGGIEGLFFNMLPVTFMDGDKIFKWNRLIWLLTMGIVTLLFWEVLLNDQRAYFDALKETTLQIALVMGGLCLGLTLGAWTFFKLRATRLQSA